jgi:hypothetical protein
MTKFVAEGVEQFIKKCFKEDFASYMKALTDLYKGEATEQEIYDFVAILIISMLRGELREEYRKEGKNERE